MPRRVLAPTDFSDASRRAVRYAADFADAIGAELDVVHIADASASPDVRARLQAVADGLIARGIATTATVVRATTPSDALLDAALAADWVVIATRGESGDQPGLGSVAAAVARHAQAPVLLVDPDTRGLPVGPRILVPVDLSPASASALRHAQTLAEHLDGSIEVVHAIDDTSSAMWGGEPVGADAEPESARRLRYVERFVSEALSAPAAPGVVPPAVRVQLAEGVPAQAVARWARDEGADLVLAGRPADRPASLDTLLAAVGAQGCPTVRVPVR